MQATSYIWSCGSIYRYLDVQHVLIGNYYLHFHLHTDHSQLPGLFPFLHFLLSTFSQALIKQSTTVVASLICLLTK